VGRDDSQEKKLPRRFAREGEGSDYARMYPAAGKWVVKCVLCGREGLDPEMPADSRFARNLTRSLEPLALDERGVCNQCGAAVDSQK
jgi:hypothetical protein